MYHSATDSERKYRVSAGSNLPRLNPWLFPGLRTGGPIVARLLDAGFGRGDEGGKPIFETSSPLGQGDFRGVCYAACHLRLDPSLFKDGAALSSYVCSSSMAFFEDENEYDDEDDSQALSKSFSDSSHSW